VTGLQNRREHEAALFELSLNSYHPLPEEMLPSGRTPTGDDKEDTNGGEVTPVGNDPKPEDEKPLNVQTPKAGYSVEVETIQRLLIAMRYYGVGTIDGLVGGKLKGSIAAFMNDRGKPPYGEITDDFKKELDKALKEGWSRPIAPDRANATTTDIAPKVASVNPIWYQKVAAFILGIPAFVTAGFKAVFGEQSTPLGYVQVVKDFFGAIPSEFYWLAVAGVAFAIFTQAKKAQDATVKAFQEGKIN
jgi:peptidoglycan hydrolase-like protein with peptidoglycan-binding domain